MAATLDIQQPMQIVSLELPKCDMAFLKKLAQKMGWSIPTRKKILSEETQKMMERSRQEFKEGKVIAFNNAADAQQWLTKL